MKYQGIYKIRNLLNGKVYIGQSTDITKRLTQHKINSKNNKKHPLYNSIRKHGLSNFEFIVLEEITNIVELDLKEQYWMDLYQSYDRGFGYNLRPKAESMKNYSHSSQTREKISNSKIGKKRKPLTIETRLKISLAKIGKPQSEEHTRKNSESHIGKLSGNKGKIASKETRLKLSLSHKGQIPWNIGKTHSQETIEKIKLGCIKRSKNPEYLKRLSDAHKGLIPWITGKKHKKESIEKMSESHKGKKRKPYTKEIKLKASAS